MTHRALLIGAQTHGLQGVDNDVAAMMRALEPRGFHVDTVTGSDATRDGILDAYRKFIEDTRRGDACVVYYSGHGGLLRKSPDDDVSVTQEDLQFIVPHDYTDSVDGDFRGITGTELSALLRTLTDITPNATVVLDCCHAAHMSRHRSPLRVRSLLRVTYGAVREHIDRLIGAGVPLARHDARDNADAVRIVACAPHESAFETANVDSVHMGLLTDALTRRLIATQGMRVNWLTLMDAVRRDVQNFTMTQRPAAEGPSSRLPFEETDLSPVATLPVTDLGRGRIRLLGAPLLDVQVGDEFVIMPGDVGEAVTDPGDPRAIATAEVDELAPASATAALRTAPGCEDVPVDARAHRTLAAAPPLAVKLPGGDLGADLRKAVAGRPLLRAAGDDEQTTVSVEVDADGRIAVHDLAGALQPPYAPIPGDHRRAVTNLQRLAQAAALRRIGDGAGAFEHHVRIEWGRVRDGRREPLAQSGALVYAHPTERIYFELHNDGDDTVHVSLVDIGISARIGLLTGSDQSGVRIGPGGHYTYGFDENRAELRGVDVTWPDGVPEVTPRPETVLVLITDKPVDVSALQQGGVRGEPGVLRGGSALARLLGQAMTGASREVGNAPAAKVRYAAVPVDFTVSPTAPPAAEEATFLLDDRPAEPVRVLSPRGSLPGRVAVRLTDVVVHRNKAFRHADVRLDTVVLTGAGASGQPVHFAQTQRFGDIGDDTRLPMDNLLIYFGPAVDYLDIAIWLSRDQQGSLALGDLISQKLHDPALQAAGAALTTVAPHGAAAVAAAGVCATVVNVAYHALLGVVGPTIGLYRTSLLAQEGFGVGSHERHPQDFSFTFSIVAVDG